MTVEVWIILILYVLGAILATAYTQEVGARLEVRTFRAIIFVVYWPFEMMRPIAQGILKAVQAMWRGVVKGWKSAKAEQEKRSK